MGKLIVIEGLDGAGKSTQTALLMAALKDAGVGAHRLDFPCYESSGSALVRAYLAGEFGDSPDSVNCYAASSFYAADRYVSYINGWRADYLNGGLFVCNRYTGSNAVFQTPKLPREQWDGFLQWLSDYEFVKLGIPAPDLTFFLDTTPQVCEKLLDKRYEGDSTRLDIHEKDKAYQLRCREAARYCAQKLSWRTVMCDDGENLRTAEDIAAEIAGAVREAGIC